MKKIETKQDLERKQKRNNLILGMLMVGLLILSTAGFALMNIEDNGTVALGETRTYKGLTFTYQQNLWVTSINQKVIAFSYMPDELEDVSVTATKQLNEFINKPLYVVNANGTKDVIAFNLLPEYIERINDACIENEPCESEEYPQKNCLIDNIIVYRKGNTTRVYQEFNCIIIEGDKAQGTDKFLQTLLGL